MTDLLEKAFNKASQLSETEQNVFARWLLEKLEADKKVDDALSTSQEILKLLSRDALLSRRFNKTITLDLGKF